MSEPEVAASEGLKLLSASLIRTWILCLLVCTASVVLSFVFLDGPLALFWWNPHRPPSSLAEIFGSTVLLGAESVVIFIVVLVRLTKGRISVFGETLAIACLCSVCAYAFNDYVLKVAFGVPNPTLVIEGARHGLNPFVGFEGSSFPSGHMVLAGAFSGVFMTRYRVSIWPLTALLMIAAVLLLRGDWHFLSDIIAGTFVGTSGGILAGKVLAAHLEKDRQPH